MKPLWLIGNIVQKNRILKKAGLLIEGEHIAEIRQTPPSRGNILRYDSSFILPGLVELHVHGAKGHDFADGEAHGNETVASFLANEGVTAYVAAIVTSAKKKTLNAVKTLVAAKNKGAKLLGILLEGPFISSQKRGAHQKRYLREPDLAFAKEIMSLIPKGLKTIFLVAPELPKALAFIKDLRTMGTLVALGHSAADYETATKAIDLGASYGVHLFNAMAPLGHREPGIAGALLNDERAYVELIPDLIHVHPAMVKLAIRAKSTARVALVTDTTGPAALPRGTHPWNGRQVTVTEKDLRLPDGTLAGSNLNNQGLFRAMSSLGFSLSDITKMRSLVPAKVLGQQRQYGSLKAGLPANITVLSEKWQTEATFINGKAVFQR